MTTRIPVSAARELSMEYQCPLVVIFGIAADQEHFVITTYGATKPLCKLAAHYGERMARSVLEGTVSAPQTEPPGLPATPVWYRGERQGEGDATRGDPAREGSDDGL